MRNVEHEPVTVIAQYRVKPGMESQMESLLQRHWAALREVGLVTDTPVQIYRGQPSAKPSGGHGAARRYVEIFEWKDAEAPQLAHHTPSVLAIWEPMGAACEDMDFPHFELLRADT